MCNHPKLMPGEYSFVQLRSEYYSFWGWVYSAADAQGLTVHVNTDRNTVLITKRGENKGSEK